VSDTVAGKVPDATPTKGRIVDIELLWERAAILRKVRRFFDERGYLETDTPLLAPALIPESCLEVFETRYLPPNSAIRQARPYWLIPSPEVWMKTLIAAHRVSVYQICKCFRNGESTGRTHSPEFTMLEYYTMDADYQTSLTLTEALFHALLEDGNPALNPPFTRITIEESFARWAGFSLEQAVLNNELEARARALGLDPLPDSNNAALYDLIFVHAVEPKLPKDKPVALMDYPAFVPCLAQKSADGKSMERWELYVRGIELANCYSEERDAEQVRRFFEQEAAAKTRAAIVPHHVDHDYPKIFAQFPRCSGVAMGLDRLIMAITGRSTIDSVLPFPME
jgi:lysyl-tRNA synthetase class 2